MGFKRILIVDDDKDILRMLEHNLKRLGSEYEIISANNINTALTQIEQQWFDLVLTDYMMPGMTGVDLARAVHRLSPETQVVLMTAYSSAKLRDTSIHIGVDGYLNKPFDMDELKALVTQGRPKPAAQPLSAAKTLPDQPKEIAQSKSIGNHLQELIKSNTGVHAVLLINAQGQIIKTAGQVDATKTANIAKLAAASFMDAHQLSGLLDNNKMFKSSFFEGDTSNIYICDVNGTALLVVIFDISLRPGVVWFYTKHTAAALASLLV